MGGSTETGGQATSSTSTNKPWGPQGAALRQGYSAAKSNILNNPTEFFGGQTFAGFSPESEAALGAQADRATSGSPLLAGAQNYTGGVLGGGAFNSNNPAWAGVSDAVTSAIRPGIDASFARAGRGGSPLHAEALGRGISRGLAPYAYGSIESAADRAPGLAREDYGDISQLADVGARREDREQLGINEDVARFEFGQNEPANRTRSYLSAIQGLPTFGTTTSAGQQQNFADTGLLVAGSAMKLLGGGK